MRKRALILGVTGQDGSYMAELLLKKGYKVYGFIRKAATTNTINIDNLINNKSIFNKSFFLIPGDLLDFSSINSAIVNSDPHEVYNFADQDHVAWSFKVPTYSFNVTAMGVLNVLEVLRYCNKKIKYFQPTSSNMFGNSLSLKQSELSDFNPLSIYALGKVSAFYLCKMYNQLYKMFNCGAIFYNHESPRRTKDYVTKKIISTVCRIYYGKENKLYLGDINQKIDWGYAKDYVEISWKIMQQKKADFFVIGTGQLTSIKEFVKKSFLYVNLDYKKYIKIDKKLLRPSKTSNLCADYSRAKKILNYKPKTNIDDLIKIMMDKELENYK